MELREFINTYPKDKRTSIRRNLADFLECSESTVKSYANGNRSVPPTLYKKIEVFTRKKVKVSDLLSGAKERKKSVSTTHTQQKH